MKKIIYVMVTLLIFGGACFAADEYVNTKKLGIIANSKLTKADYEKAQKIILNIHKETLKRTNAGYGPFYAEIYDENGKFIAGAANSVVKEKCSHNHAEMNTIREAQKKLKTYDLTPYNLTMYVNAEPCVMCAGATMWSGIKTIYYSVPSADVEKILGFDEGYKPNWQRELKKRGITVYGNIEADAGKTVMHDYMAKGKVIYKPSR